MRSYSGLLVFESVFDNIDPNNQLLTNLGNQVFNPRVQIVDVDCGTSLGQTVDLTYEAEGYVEVATGSRFSNSRINTLLSQGVYEAQIRNISTCISKGGVCQTCYKASNPHLAIPQVLSRVNIPSSFVMGAEIINIPAGTSTAALTTDASLYDLALPFSNGALLSSPTYNISNGVFSLTTPAVSNMIINVRYIVYSRTPFMYWLAKTYSGSMLGMKPLPAPMLPIKASLLSSLISDASLSDAVTLVKSNPAIPEDSIRYLDSITDPLEKLLYSISLGSIYSNVLT